jgi:hypothetical protein
MKNLLGLAIIVAVAVAMILTKPTPQEIALAAAGRMNYTIVNRDRMPKDFVAAVAAAALLQSVQDIFAAGGDQKTDGPVRWRTRDLVFLTSSDLTLANTGSLRCLWLLRNGFCAYFSA